MDAVREQRSVRPGLALVEEPPDTPPGERRPKRRWIIGVLAFAVVATIVAFSIMPRIQARSVVHKETAQMALPYVSVVRPKQSAPAEEVILPANVQAYYDAPIYARTNGYLKKWYVDIGARVRKGQLLAEIDTPEVDQQLRQARANLATAQANLALSETTSALKAYLKPILSPSRKLITPRVPT